MKATVEIPADVIDAVTREELKSLRTKNAKLVSQNESLKREVSKLKHEAKLFTDARVMVVELAELLDIQTSY